MSTATETADDAPCPRLKQKYHDEVKGALQERARPRQRHAGAEAREDRHQHGRRPGHPAAVAARGRGRRPHRDQPARSRSSPRPATSIAGFKLREGQSIGCKVTLARRPHVGVLRPAGQRRHPPHPRLPRPAGQQLGRPWQLHVRSHRADRVPGDRLRQDRRTRVAWTSPSSPPPPPTSRARRCSTRSASRSSARPTCRSTGEDQAPRASVPRQGRGGKSSAKKK